MLVFKQRGRWQLRALDRCSHKLVVEASHSLHASQLSVCLQLLQASTAGQLRMALHSRAVQLQGLSPLQARLHYTPLALMDECLCTPAHLQAKHARKHSGQHTSRTASPRNYGKVQLAAAVGPNSLLPSSVCSCPDAPFMHDGTAAVHVLCGLGQLQQL
jgi:hypothetical protein